MGWINIAAIPISQEWQFTSPINDLVQSVRVRNGLGLNFEPIFNNYGFISQVDNFKDFANYRRIYPTKDNVVIEFIKPIAFKSRRIAVRLNNRIRTKISWIVNIDVWID